MVYFGVLDFSTYTDYDAPSEVCTGRVGSGFTHVPFLSRMLALLVFPASSFVVATALCCGGFPLPLFGFTPSLGLFFYGVVFLSGATFSSFMLVGIAGFLVFLSL